MCIIYITQVARLVFSPSSHAVSRKNLSPRRLHPPTTSGVGVDYFKAYSMRALLRPFAAAAARNPIEVIVVGFIAATLAYFHVLDAIRHSTFLSPSIPTSLRPAHALLQQQQWAAVPETVWQDNTNDKARLELQQVIFSLDSSRPGKTTNSNIAQLLTDPQLRR